jgi:glutamate 5-kinase
MYTYDKLFSEYNHTVAQILLTASDLSCDDRHEKFRNTMAKLLEMGVLPIINENDTVATEEIAFGDNDTLAAKIAVSTSANLLVLLSDIDGLYTADPHKDINASLISVVKELSEDILALAGKAGSKLGTGGMATKLKAAKIATDDGCDMIITNGEFPERLYSIIDGAPVGTRFYAKKN